MALTDDLKAFYEFESDGSDAHSVGPYDLTAVNTPTFVSGKVGNAADVVTDSYFHVASNADLATGDVDYTHAGWVMIDSNAEFGNIISKWGSADADKEYNLRYHHGVQRFQFAIALPAGAGTQTVDADNLGVPSAGTWYFVVAWHDSVNNVIGIAVNGGTANTTAHSAGSNAGTFRVEYGNGSQVTATTLNGQLDQWGFWKRVLTSQERTDLYNAGAGLSYAAMGGGDVTPPTLSDFQTNIDGDQITATISESGCTPASGTGGFTLSGTSATVASWAISGTTLTITLSGAVAFGETVTIDYDDATASEAIADAATNLLADIADAAVTNNVPDVLAAGTASFVSSGPTEIVVEATAASGGVSPYTYQWQRSTTSGSGFSDLTNGGGVSGATTLTLTDGSASAGTLYFYRIEATDDDATVDESNEVSAQIYDGGPLTGGGAGLIGETGLVF